MRRAQLKKSISKIGDALGLVLVHPVRRLRQAHHALEVGHVDALRLGELGAQVAIALAPDHECRRLDGADPASALRGVWRSAAR